MSAEAPHPLTEPQEILAAKETILSQWSSLPPEHQATTMLLILRKTLAGEYGLWLKEAVDLLYTIAVLSPSPHSAEQALNEFPIPFTKATISRSDFVSLVGEAEAAALTDKDIAGIAKMLGQCTGAFFVGGKEGVD